MITIHNKERLIRNVIFNVINIAGINSHIYPIFDGCTDLSEAIVDEVIQSYPKVKITKLYASDVHELKTINVGLTQSDQTGEGFNIILQDDVFLKDKDLEIKCINLYKKFAELGIVSFRHGGNISRQLLQYSSCLNPLEDYIQSECGHYPNPESMLKLGYFTFKEAVIKSPICIPFQVIREIGPPDESYAPWDDLAYAYKVSAAGYSNGIYALDFQSDVGWGTTRNKNQAIQVEEVQSKNLNLFRLHYPDLPPLDRNKYSGQQFLIDI